MGSGRQHRPGPWARARRSSSCLPSSRPSSIRADGCTRRHRAGAFRRTGSGGDNRRVPPEDSADSVAPAAVTALDGAGLDGAGLDHAALDPAELAVALRVLEQANALDPEHADKLALQRATA